MKFCHDADDPIVPATHHQPEENTMSETVVTIHYQSPAEDPFTVPRPTRIQFDSAGNIQTTGGEELIGLSRQDPAPGGHGRGLGHRLCGPPELFDAGNWVQAEDLLSEGAADLELAGWFPAFMSGCGEWIYTWSGAVDRVEVTETEAKIRP